MNFYNNQGFNYPYIQQNANTQGNYYYQNPSSNYNTPPKPTYLPMMLVTGIEGTKDIIVLPNQSVYLKDSDSDLMFLKQADAQGRYSLKAYDLKEIALEDVGKPAQSLNLITREDFEVFKKDLTESVKALNEKIDSVYKGKETSNE